MTSNLFDSRFDGTVVDNLPPVVDSGTIFLLAGSVKNHRALLGLWILEQYLDDGDYATLVTTELSAETLITDHLTNERVDDLLRLGIVDTTSKRQSLTMVYQPVPTIYTPHHGDVTRTSMAISELDGVLFRPGGRRHLLISSFTSILEDMALETVSRFIDSVTNQSSRFGCTLLDIDFTKHDSETLDVLRTKADGIIWAEEQTDGSLSIEYDRL